MQQKKGQQWEIMEQLLPMLMKTVENRRKMLRLEETMKSTEQYLNKKKNEIQKLRYTQQIAEGELREAIIRKIKKISEKIRSIETFEEENQEMYLKIRKEVEDNDSLYRKSFEDLKGIKIRNDQITFKEFEGLLYLMWIIPRFSKSDLFDEKENIYPSLAWKLEANYDGKDFYTASFEKVFGIY